MKRALLLVISAVALVTAACGTAGAQPAAPAGSIDVQLTEWRVTVSSTAPQAGPLTFAVRNTGSIAHDLTILKTDLPADKLPQDSGRAIETGKVAATAMLNPGQSARLAVTLQPGNYVFLCNEQGHYALGMHTAVKIG